MTWGHTLGSLAGYHFHFMPNSMSQAEEALICWWEVPMVERSK